MARLTCLQRPQNNPVCKEFFMPETRDISPRLPVQPHLPQHPQAGLAQGGAVNADSAAARGGVSADLANVHRHAAPTPGHGADGHQHGHGHGHGHASAADTGHGVPSGPTIPRQDRAAKAPACAAPATGGARAPGAPRIALSCCPPEGGGKAAAPAARTAGAAHDHDHDHGHGTPAAGEAAPHGEHSDHDGHDHSALPGWGRIGAALLAAIGAELLHLLGPDTTLWHGAGMVLAAAAILLAGLGVYQSGVRSLLRGQLGISALMAVAVTGAFAIGQWPEAAMVMALYALAESIEERAVGRARHAIGALLALSPEQAEVQGADGQWQRVPAAEVALGALVRIRPGGRVPLDGTVTRGRSAVDESSVTGESLAVDKAPGDLLLAGTLTAPS